MEFSDLLKNSKSSDLIGYLKEANNRYKEYLAKEVEIIRQFKKEQKSNEVLREKIFTPSSEALEKAQRLLFSGQVCGADGTKSSFITLPNIHCRVGICGLSYSGTGEVGNEMYYLDETSIPLSEKIDNATDFLKEVAEKRKKGSFDFYLKAFMWYREREFILEKRNEPWRIAHGPLVPIELLRFEEGFELIKKIVEHKQIIGVISESRNPNLKVIGSVLDRGQYFKGLDKHTRLLEHFQEVEPDRLKEKHWQRFFDSGIGKGIITGIYRTGLRSYVFEAHEDIFDDAVAIMMADSMLQTEKGFPLLIDMADQYCRAYFSSAEFKNTLAGSFVDIGFEEYGQDLEERELREY